MIRRVEDVDIESRRVLVRVDLDCPVREGEVRDDFLIRASLPTLRHTLNRRAKVVVMAHRGRPGGRREPELSMEPVGMALAELLDMDVVLADDCVGDGARKVVSDLYGGRIVLLENLAFHASEERNDDRFARDLAEMADVYVNDAFSMMGKPHASVVGVASHVRDRCAGLLVSAEMEALGRLAAGVRRPFVVLVGGTRVAARIRTMQQMMDRVDAFLLGGAVGCTFLAARGFDMGESRVDEGSILHARSIMEDARKKSVRILAPVDLVSSRETHPGERLVTAVGDVGRGFVAQDIGPATIRLFQEELGRAVTVLWTGPLGRSQDPPCHEGTRAIAETLSLHLGYRVVAGAETIHTLRQHCPGCRLDYVCKGDEASFEFLEGRPMVGLKALEI